MAHFADQSRSLSGQQDPESQNNEFAGLRKSLRHQIGCVAIAFLVMGGVAAVAAYASYSGCPNGEGAQGIDWAMLATVAVVALVLESVVFCRRPSLSVLLIGLMFIGCEMVHLAFYGLTDCQDNTFRGWSDVFLIFSFYLMNTSMITLSVMISASSIQLPQDEICLLREIGEACKAAARSGSPNVLVVKVSDPLAGTLNAVLFFQEPPAVSAVFFNGKTVLFRALRDGATTPTGVATHLCENAGGLALLITLSEAVPIPSNWHADGGRRLSIQLPDEQWQQVRSWFQDRADAFGFDVTPAELP